MCLRVKAVTLEILEMFSTFYFMESIDLTNKQFECRLLMFSEIFKRGGDVFELDEWLLKRLFTGMLKNKSLMRMLSKDNVNCMYIYEI